MAILFACFRGFVYRRKTSKFLHEPENGISDSLAGLRSADATRLPVLEAVNLSTEWAGSQFPVACITLGEHTNGSARARQVTVLWHNSTRMDVWERLMGNLALVEAMVAAVSGQGSGQQIVLVPGSTFIAQDTQPAAAAARFTSDLLAAVSVPVHLSLVQFSTGPRGGVVPRALLLVCRAPVLPPRHADGGGSCSQQATWDTAYQGVQSRPEPLSMPNPNMGLERMSMFPSGSALLRGNASDASPYKDDNDAVAATALQRYPEADGTAMVAAHRQRDSMVAAHLPAIITVYTLDGQVVHQNPASVQYMGPMPVSLPHGSAPVADPTCGAGGKRDGCGEVSDAADGDEDLGDENDDFCSGLGVLGHIFKYEQAKLRQMMDVLLGRGNVWQGIVRVPSSKSLKSMLVFEKSPAGDALVAGRLQGRAAAESVAAAEAETLAAITSPAVVNGCSTAAASEVEDVNDDDDDDGGDDNDGKDFRSRLRPSVRIQLHPDSLQPHHVHPNQEQQQQPSLQQDPEWGPTVVRKQQQQCREHEGPRQASPRRQQSWQGLEDGRQQQQRQQQQQQQEELQQGDHLIPAPLDDGNVNLVTQDSSMNFILSSLRPMKVVHSNHVTNHNASISVTTLGTTNTPGSHPLPPPPQQPPGSGSGGTTVEVQVDTGSYTAIITGGLAAPGQELPRGRTAAKAAGSTLYDAEADPLATSTWTVLADPGSRGWPVNQPHANHNNRNHYNHQTKHNVQRRRSRAGRPSKRDRPGNPAIVTGDTNVVDTKAHLPSGPRGQYRRWASALEPAATVEGAAAAAETCFEGVEARLRGSGKGVAPSPSHGPPDTTVVAVAAAGVSTEAAAAGTVLESTSDAGTLLHEMHRLDGSPHHGGGGGGGSGLTYGSNVLPRRSGTSLPVAAASGQTDPATSSITSGASATSGLSRVLLFANSLRSAPFAVASATAANAAAMTTAPVHIGRQSVYGLGGAGAAGTGTVATPADHQTLRAKSASSPWQQSEALRRLPAASRPGSPGQGAEAAAAAMLAAHPPPTPPLASVPARPEVTALTALLRARRSSLVKAGPAASLPPAPAPPAATDADTAADDYAAVASMSLGRAAAAANWARARSSVLAGDCDPPARPSNSSGGGGSRSGPTPITTLVTAGKAELAMALLPYSHVSEAPERQQSGLADSGFRLTGGCGAAGSALAAAEEMVAVAGDEAGGGGGGGGGGEHDVWHEISAVSALDPVTGAAVLVVTQVDVTAKVRAERHLVHVMCAERRLLLQLFPRHVLQHVVEANPLLHSQHPASASGFPAAPSSLESLPREWLEGGDWRPVLRDCDKLATMHPQATVLFADIAGFDDLCMELPPQQVLAFLNDLFAKFDNSIEPFGVHKMETIGGLFIVAGGLLREEEDGAVAVRDRWDPLHAEKVFMFAKAMLNVAARTKLPSRGEPVKLRIGIHTGPVMSGIVGTRVPRFVLFGDTVNTASRMQTSATPGSIHMSEDTRALLPHENWTPTGGVQIKGKGLLNTYVWVPEEPIQYIVPPAASTPEASNRTGTGSGGVPTGTGSVAAAAAAALTAGGGGGGGGLLASVLDTSSCTSSDVFLAQQLSFTSALPTTLLRGKSRLRNEGGYL